MDCSPPGSSMHGILQERILQWIAMPSSRESFQPRNWTWVSYVPCIDRQVLCTCANWEACVSGKGPLTGILEVVRKNNFTLLQKHPWLGWIEMFSMLLWCLPQSMLLPDLAESQSTCLALSKLPGAPVGKLELDAKGAPRPLHSSSECSFLSTRGEAPVFLLLFSFLFLSLGQSVFESPSSLQ